MQKDWQEFFMGILPIIVFYAFAGTILNIVLAEFIHRYVVMDFKRFGSAEKSLQKMKYLKYAYFFVTAIFVILIIIFLLPVLVELVSPFVAVNFPFLYIFIIRIGSSMIFSRTYDTLRDLKETVKQIVWQDLRDLLFSVIPIFTFVNLFSIFLYIIRTTGLELTSWLVSIFSLFNIIVNSLSAPFIYKSLLRSVPIQDRNLELLFNCILERHSIKKRLIYQYFFEEDAMVFVSLFNRIFVSDHFLTLTSNEEKEAILIHEIAHIKKRHLHIQITINLCFVVFTIASIHGLSFIGYIMEFNFPVFLYYVIGFILTMINNLFLHPIISKIHERQADEYVIKSGMDQNILISALDKTIESDARERLMSKIEEKFSTHPSLENRIKYIREFAESMRKQNDVQEISLHKTT